MGEIRLSIIIPVYNVEKYLKECLESLVNQKLKSMEVILINDGSTDDSEKICREYLERYDFIKLISQKNSGPGISRNKGIACAKGKYIGFVDSDDFVDENMYTKLIDIAENENLDFVGCAIKMFFEGNSKSKVIENNNSEEVLTNEQLTNEILKKNIQCFSCNKIFKRELFDDIKYEEGVYYEDIYTVFRLALKCNRGKHINEPLYFYRQRQNNITNNISIKHIRDFNSAVEKINKYYIKVSNYNKELLQSFNVNYFFTSIDLYIKNKNFKLKEINKNYNKEYCNYTLLNVQDLIFNRFISIKCKFIYFLWKSRILVTLKNIKYIFFNVKK